MQVLWNGRLGRAPQDEEDVLDVAGGGEAGALEPEMPAPEMTQRPAQGAGRFCIPCARNGKALSPARAGRSGREGSL